MLVATTAPSDEVISPRSAGTATMLKRLLSATLDIAEESRACNRNSCAPKRLRTKSPASRRDLTRRSGWLTLFRAGRDGGLRRRRGEPPPAVLDAGDLCGVGDAETRVGRASPGPRPRVRFTSSPLCWLGRPRCSWHSRPRHNRNCWLGRPRHSQG